MGVIGRWGQNLIGSRCWLRWWGPAAGYCPNQFAGITERSMVSLNDPTEICPTISSIRTLHFMGHAPPIQCMIGSLSAHQRENVESPVSCSLLLKLLSPKTLFKTYFYHVVTL
ncbi:hypothetical protein ACSQ67_007065 [Phaseolus vulgaris]